MDAARSILQVSQEDDEKEKHPFLRITTVEDLHMLH